MHTIRVAHSPDSDDAFMYYGIACGAVRAEGIRFEQALSDIESANAAAREGRFDVTAISAAAYPHLAGRYLLLDSGASFGDGYGPAVVVPAGSKVARLEDLAGKRIATPGVRTSAALALALRLPHHVAVPMDFKAVGPAALRGEVEAGLVIHEGQLTAAEDGLRVVEDLGESWKARTGLPLPLGLNAVKRDLPEPVRRAAAVAWKASIDYGLAHREQALDYAMTFARGLDRAKADTFVGMYVNDWTRELGPRGREAVARFLGEAAERGLVPRVAIEYQERGGSR
jgi:1,4-dihydroxy-6-naphthoate synthase